MSRAALVSLALLVALAGCDKPGAWGDANSIVLVTGDDLWTSIEQPVYDALETRITTVRDEKMFTVTHQDPTDEYWDRLKKFKQMLLVEDADAPWVREALDRAEQELPDPPAVVQVHDVWARGQLVTVALLPPDGKAAALESLLPELSELYREQYGEWARARMFITGRNTELADTLAREAGFSLLLPNVYDWSVRDGVYRFRNDNPDPSELIREIAVTWRTPAEPVAAPDSLLAWRSAVAERAYLEPQALDTTLVEHNRVLLGNLAGIHVRGVWQNTPEADWPAAGPFITRSFTCAEQDRTYFLDAWLYAPGREKFEYMIQLETILDSFRCGDGSARAE